MSSVVSMLEVLIQANTRDLVAGLRDADREVGGFGARAGAAMRRVATLTGGALVGIGVGAANAAISWESSWTNVEKTVSGSEEELSALEEALRGMAQSDVLGAMENAHGTLAEIAAAAGALGVETSAIDEFTSAVAALSIAADDVTADEIATAAAQFANVTGMDIAEDIDNWANAIARLGNEGASTEGQILGFANRMSALATYGFNEQDILGYSGAMASLGLTAELGASNFVKTVSMLTSAVATGGPELETFASIAGMTADEFQRWADSDDVGIAGLLDEVTRGLSQIDAAEQLALFEDLGINGMEQQRVLMTLASGWDTVAQSLDTSYAAWGNGTDAMDEASRKAGTTQGGINELMNNINDLSISIGEKLLPGINDMVEGLMGIVDGDLGGGLGDIGLGIAGILDNFTGGDTQGGFQAWLDSMSMLPTVISLLGNSIGIIFDNIKRTFQRAFLEIKLAIVEKVLGLRQTIMDLTASLPGGPIDIAPAMNMDLTNLRIEAGSMDIADELTRVLQDSVKNGVIDLSGFTGGGVFGTAEVGIENFVEFLSPEQSAQAFGAEARQTITEAIELAISQGDEGAITALTPLANELEIDIAAIQADLQAAMAAQSFPVTVTADMTVVPGSMTLPGGMQGPIPPPAGGGAGAVPGQTNGGNQIVVNSYGQNPWQMAGLVQQATSDSGVR